MPRGDRTGPMGMGPMSGRGAGYCAGNSVAGYMNDLGWGRGMRRGRGCGSGFGWMNGFRGAFANSPVPFTQTDELSALKNQENYFRQVLQSLKNRISEIESEKE